MKVVAVLALVFIAACEPNPCGVDAIGVEGAPCEASDQCGDGLACDYGCADEIGYCGGTCHDENDPNAFCRTGATCSTNESCEEGADCIRGWCTAGF